MSIPIMVVGNSGSGKSETAKCFAELTIKEGFTPEFISDRILLEEAVIKDTQEGRLIDFGEEQVLEGNHSILIDGRGPWGEKKVHVRDGTLLNKIHWEMIEQACQPCEPEVVRIFEYATGPVINFGEGLEPLEQDGKSLARELNNRRVAEHPLVICGVDSEYPYRLARNEQRSDGLDKETFKLYFPDGGELGREGASLLPRGVVYCWIPNNNNEGSDRLREEIETAWRASILPIIEGQRPKKEREI